MDEFVAPPPSAQARPGAPLDPTEYTIPVDEAAERYAHAGHPRTLRRLQKYCARGDLDCMKVETAFGERYLITSASIDRHIAQVEEGLAASGRAPTRPGASMGALEIRDISEPEVAPPPSAPTPSGRAPTRPPAPEDAAPGYFQERYLGHLEQENQFLRDQNTVLLERVKETNIITAKLQAMLSPLLGSSERREPPEHRDTEEGRGIHANQQIG